MSYPIILLPNEANRIKLEMPDKPEEPLKPAFPEKIYPKKPYSPKEPSGFNIGYIISILMLFIGLIVREEESWGYWLIIIGIVLFIIIIRVHIMARQSYKDKMKVYREERLKYKNAIQNFEDSYAREVRKYNKFILPEYEIKHTEYLNRIKEIESPKYLLIYRFEKLKNFFADATKPQKINETINFNKGVTEDFFYSYLRKHFHDSVQRNIAIKEDEFDGLPYIPDFVVHIIHFNLYIDIEIDEPYIGKDGTPIHFKNGPDEERDEFFNQNKWVVVRFAEIQVIKHPDLCCNLIKKLIQFIFEENQKPIKNIKDIVPNTSRWTKDEAHRLAFTRSRNQYLNKELVENLSEEKKELEKKFLSLFNEVEQDDLPFY